MIDFLNANYKVKEYAQDLYESRGLTPKRLRWDILRNAGLMNFVCDILYKYLDDSHIDTALRTVMRSVGISWAAGK